MRNSLQSERTCCPQKSEGKPFPVPSLLNQRMHAHDPGNPHKDQLTSAFRYLCEKTLSFNYKNMKETNDKQKKTFSH
jgi:hypothetical protein